MSDKEVRDLLESQRICRMAFNDNPQPYIIPLDYVYINGRLYFHFADYGIKLELYRKSPYVSVEIDSYNADITSYRSITLMGKLSLVTDPEERESAARALLNSVDRRGGSGNVAARHGFTGMDLKTLSSGDSVLLRLDVTGSIGLKSP
ncbi:MAG TPA: pyridoxamine 5'-phosphate oxidase family protein [Methanocella sp.]|nr:pyridoxamine 5'-phosphate oxidase family protein [Methanocella sp.]